MEIFSSFTLVSNFQQCSEGQRWSRIWILRELCMCKRYASSKTDKVSASDRWQYKSMQLPCKTLREWLCYCQGKEKMIADQQTIQFYKISSQGPAQYPGAILKVGCSGSRPLQ